jgi:hypothetical protein
MTNMDFNNAEPQRGFGDLIPDNTIALVVAKLRPGGAGPGGWLKASATGCDMMDLEFVVDGGEFDRRKFWGLFVTSGCTEGHEKAANITRSRLRAMLESAHGINAGDNSQAALAKRQVSGWGAFDGRYTDKNVLKAALTPDDTGYINPGPQAANAAGNASAGPASGPAPAAATGTASAKPNWAQ